MNIYREMLACFIGVSAIPLLEKSKKDKIFLYYCLVALASGFHNSALILVLFPLAKKLNISRSLSYSLIILTLIMGIVLPYNFLGGYLGVYDRLVETDVNTRSENEVILAVFLAIYWIGEFFLIDKMSTITFKSRIYYKILFLGVLANNLLIKQALGLRVILYFNILQIITLPLLIDRNKKDNWQKKALLIIYISIFFLVFLFSNSARVVPYVINDISYAY